MRASATENPELLWALRGGGGNFGVVTALELTLHPVGPEVLAGLVVYPEARAGELLRAFRDLMRDAPDELSLAYAHLTIPEDPDFAPEWHGRAAVAVAGMWAGDPADGEPVLAGSAGSATRSRTCSASMPYADFQCALDDPPGYRNYWTAEQADDLPDALVDALVAHCGERPAGPSQLFLVGWGGAMAGSGASTRRSPSAARASSCTRWRCGRTRPTTRGRSPGRAGSAS